MTAKKTFLELVANTDNVPYPNSPPNLTTSSRYKAFNSAVPFYSHDGVQIGLVPKELYSVLSTNELFADHFTFTSSPKPSISLAPHLTTFQQRNKAIAEVGHSLRQFPVFRPVLSGWRDELYVVYNPSHVEYMLVERAVSVLFGVVTYGVHINGYIGPGHPVPKRVCEKSGKEMYKLGHDSNGNERKDGSEEKEGSAEEESEEIEKGYKFWISKRSSTKATFPNMLDNTVAGGLGYPHGIYESAVKECGEEAGLSPEYAKRVLKPVGCLTYWFMKEYKDNYSSEEGEKGKEGEGLTLFQPECEYIYDMQMDSFTIPTPFDGEVADFRLLTLSQLKSALSSGAFKPNCALVAIDFLIRHGLVGAEKGGEKSEKEEDYVEIVQRMHRRFDYPMR